MRQSRRTEGTYQKPKKQTVAFASTKKADSTRLRFVTHLHPRFRLSCNHYTQENLFRKDKEKQKSNICSCFYFFLLHLPLQSCIYFFIQRLSSIRKERGLDFEIYVDGGIDNENGPKCKEKGADILVAGKLCIFRDKGKLEKQTKEFISALS